MRTDEGFQQELENREEMAEYLLWLALSSINDYNRYIEYERLENGHAKICAREQERGSEGERFCWKEPESHNIES
jgi:hypothetical protein